ncbi:MAG: hypothetical protein IT271_09340 [Chitinophagales bacterium]|nr:hypothetical protein [Chitinophagales bacterium]
MQKVIITLIIGICFYTSGMAQKQPISKKQFDELWNKADSSTKIVIKTGNSTKDLNALERDNIKAVDIKQKTVTNPNYNFKKVDTSNLEELSTQPIVKGSGSKTKTTSKPKEAVITNIPSKLKDTLVTKVKETIPVKVTETKEPKKVISGDDFSTQPIVKGKKAVTEIKEETYTKPVKKAVLDTTKNFKEFTFEGTPIVNKNASYTRKDEPMPKSKEQIDDEIPVNRKPNNTNVDKDNSFMKEAYAQYDKEADSLHTANKRRLDSIMQALNIKVPVVINPTEFIDIYVNGGGTIAEGNSKLYDRISILHTGIVQREYKTKNEGVQRTEKKISKDELTKLAQYIVDMGFLDFNAEYDCADEDAACNQRFSKSPQVVPMEVSLTAGQRKNKVKVSIFAPKTEKNLVNYPANLEKIMNAIYTIVEK